MHQVQLEAAGHWSSTWIVLRALQSLQSAQQLQGESAVLVTASPFFQSAGREKAQFWGSEQGPTVFLWDCLDEVGRKEGERIIQTQKDWVVWSRARPTKEDKEPRGFQSAGKTIFCGKAKRSQREQGKLEAEEELDDDAPKGEVDVSRRASRRRGWLKRGVVETNVNIVNMTAWVHKECVK